MFSRSCEYALQAVLYITLHSSNKAVGLTAIAKSQKIPAHFLSKILQLLVKHKILNSTKGPNGGFNLNVAAKRLTLLEIVKIVDGLDIFDKCGIGLKTCSDKNPCPIHNDFKIVKNKIRQLLSEKTVAELCEDVKNGSAIVNLKG
ncbi:MAG: Rrf2 family transcriptional regulator [Cytophagales bacterium]|nr:Rrf2 family transcriptional regulator [Cytophagales bacterium]